VPTAKLNKALELILAERGPSPKRGTKPVKIYYGTQVSVAPPTIVFSCNHPQLVTDNYRRFMENRLRTMLPFSEVPIRLLFRGHRAEEAEAQRKRPAAAGRRKPGSSRKRGRA
jgi:GTP-binding protein